MLQVASRLHFKAKFTLSASLQDTHYLKGFCGVWQL